MCFTILSGSNFPAREHLATTTGMSRMTKFSLVLIDDSAGDLAKRTACSFYFMGRQLRGREVLLVSLSCCFSIIVELTEVQKPFQIM